MNFFAASIFMKIMYCAAFTGYDLFHGFDVTAKPSGNTEFGDEIITTTEVEKVTNHTSTAHTLHTVKNSTVTPITTNATKSTQRPTKSPNICPEVERPSSIGTYEVPTQRDLVLFTRSMLINAFDDFNKNALFLLKDIKEATRSTSVIEKKCQGDKLAYRQCVKRTSTQCEQITKNAVKTLEHQKRAISDLFQGTVCSLEDMKTDPLQMLKALVQEKTTLEFALPAFLRLLDSCSSHCTTSKLYDKKPSRHLTDHDLVVQHFLTRKNYIQLVKDSNHKI